MNRNEDSTDRRPGEYFLFALGFGGFLIGASGLGLSVAGLALTGAIIFLLAVAAFGGLPGP